jgi:phosphate transport system permease protein
MNRTSVRVFLSRAAGGYMFLATMLALMLLLVIASGLFVKAYPILKQSSLWSLLTGAVWAPIRGFFGFLPFISGTLWVTGIAIVLALPVSLLTGIYLSEYAPSSVRKIAFSALDILSGIPPVVYGAWGVLVVVPFIAEWVAPYFVEYSSGYSVLSAGIVLGIMIIPLLVSLFGEVFSTVPKEIRDSALSLGATSWQTTKKVVLKSSLPGIFAATVLAISRALGETIAVLMVCGNVVQIPASLLDAGYPLPALIANNYGEMASLPGYEAALMLAALILLGIVIVFNTLSRILLLRIGRKYALQP